jgi:hypothetical protein
MMDECCGMRFILKRKGGDRWITLLRKAGFIDLRYTHFQRMGVFLVKKPLKDLLLDRASST